MKLLVAVILLSVVCCAQTHTEMTLEDNQTITGNKTFSGSNSDVSSWSTTGPGWRLDSGNTGFQDNVLGTGQAFRKLTAKSQLPNSPASVFYSAAVFESWIGTYNGGALSGPAIVTLYATADRNLNSYTGQLFAVNHFCRDSSTSGLTGKGPIRCLEQDFINNSTEDATLGNTSEAGKAQNSDWEQNGIFLQSGGSNKGGIGLLIKSNNPGAGNWKRGLVIKDYDSFAIHLIHQSGNGDNMLVLDSTAPSQNEDILWNDNGQANSRWIMGKNTSGDWSVFDSVDSAQRIRFTVSSGGNSGTEIDAFGSGGVKLATNNGNFVEAGKILQIDTGMSNNAGGFKHKRGTAGCATAASAGATCTTTITWTTTFADANYTATCTGDAVTSGVPLNGGLTAKIAASVTFQTVAGTAAAAQYTNIDCVAVHD